MRGFLLYALSLAAMAAPVAGWSQQNRLGAPPLGLDVYLPLPDDGPMRPDVVELGQALFFDPILSVDSTVACADCHRPELAFANRLATSIGVEDRQGTRNVPAILNRAYGRAFFWDGRIDSLDEQVLQPIMAEDEMALELSEAIDRLASDSRYRDRFSEVFGRAVNRTNLANALASFVRTIQAGNSPFDRFNAGDSTALNELELKGLDIFQGKGRCVRCHTGTNLTDENFHNTGVAWRDGAFQDEGRAIVTGEADDRGLFKTPTLREVSRTAPYMHDGSFLTLEEVVDFYSDGGRANPNLDAELRPFDLAPDEKLALIAFLESLSGNIRSGL